MPLLNALDYATVTVAGSVKTERIVACSANRVVVGHRKT
jgi:hypothetical protein